MHLREQRAAISLLAITRRLGAHLHGDVSRLHRFLDHRIRHNEGTCVELQRRS